MPAFCKPGNVAFPPAFECSSVGSIPAYGLRLGTDITELIAHICEGSSLHPKQPELSGLPGVPVVLARDS